MFDIAKTLMIQLIDLMPGFLALWLIFDFMASLLFGKR